MPFDTHPQESQIRFSIIPAKAVTDDRLKGADIRILAVIGMHADRNGFCWLNQGRIAERIGLSREWVSKSCRRLLKCGYIKMQDLNQAKGIFGKGKTINLYRVIFDLPDDPDMGFLASTNHDLLEPPCELQFTSDETGTSEGGCELQFTGVVNSSSQLNVPIKNDKKDILSASRKSKPDLTPEKISKADTTQEVESPLSQRVRDFVFDEASPEKKLSAQIRDAAPSVVKGKILVEHVAWAIASFRARAKQLGQTVPRVNVNSKIVNRIRRLLRQYGLDEWQRALAGMDNDHWNGNNDRGWKGNLLTFTTEDSFIRLAEGHHGKCKRRQQEVVHYAGRV